MEMGEKMVEMGKKAEGGDDFKGGREKRGKDGAKEV